MKGLINFADILPKNQHIKKNVLSVKMYVIAWGCCRYICLPRVSSRSKQARVQESVLHLAMELGQPGKKT